jgi:hypothetical protein
LEAGRVVNDPGENLGTGGTFPNFPSGKTENVPSVPSFVRADMYRRLGRTAEARASYEEALALTQQEPERQFLQERIRQLE